MINQIQVKQTNLSPAGAYAIGQYFKNNNSLNSKDGGNRAGEGSKSHLLAHGLLAFATSYATGQSPNTITATTLSTMGAEKLAPKLSKYLYGTDKVADLRAEQKQTISDILGTAGLVAGGVTAQATGADSISSVSVGQQVQSSVQNAVENNRLLYPKELKILTTKAQELARQHSNTADPELLKQDVAYWNNLLYILAYASVDTKAKKELQRFYANTVEKSYYSFSAHTMQSQLYDDIMIARQAVIDLQIKYANDKVKTTEYNTAYRYLNHDIYMFNPSGLADKHDVYITVGKSLNDDRSKEYYAFHDSLKKRLEDLSTKDDAITSVYPEEWIGTGYAIGKGVIKGTQAILTQYALKEAEKKAIKNKVIDNNINVDNPSLIHHSAKEFTATKGNPVIHRAENINLGQTIDRDGLTRVDKAKEFNDDQIANNLGLKNRWQLSYHPTGYPAWKPGTVVTDRVLDKPERMRMVIDKDQYHQLMGQGDKYENYTPEQRKQALGRWATQEPINSVADMRQRLAVTEDFKSNIAKDGTPNKFYVVEFEVQAGVGVREGIAGTMFDRKTGQVMPGGVKQVNFVKESVHTDPDKFIIDLDSIKEIK